MIMGFNSMIPIRYLKVFPIKHSYLIRWLVFLFFALPPLAQAENVTLSWSHPDDTVVENYRIFQRLSGQSYNYNEWVYQGTDTTCVITDLAPNSTYYFVVRAYSVDEESNDSNEVSHTTITYIPDYQDDDTGTAIVIDNGDKGSTSKGTWKKSRAANPYGDNSLYSRQALATYTFKTQNTGEIDISLWWTQDSKHSSTVPVIILDGKKLIDIVYVDQTHDGGQWNLLGSYSFTDNPSVIVISKGRSASTCADAVRFKIIKNSNAINSAD